MGRMHLDSLLEQGTSQSIKEEIISLSEEFHIITPYTSLLVLETDADRERFKVQRRFQMRDGEKFFAEGRDNAQFELAQQQIRNAASYRLGLRRMMLQQLSVLGRDPQMFQQNIYDSGAFDSTVSMIRPAGAAGRPASRMPMGGGGGFGGGSGGFGGRSGRGDSWFALGDFSDELQTGFDVSSISGADAKGLGRIGDEDMDEMGLPNRVDELNGAWDGESFTPFAGEPLSGRGAAKRESRLNSPAMWDVSADVASPSFFYESLRGRLNYGVGKPMYYRPQPDYVAWFNELFPQIPAATKSLPPPADSKWTAEARTLAESLLRVAKLKQLDGGILVQRRTDQFDTRLDLHNSCRYDRGLFAQDMAHACSESANAQTQIQWVRGPERGIYSALSGWGDCGRQLPMT